MHMRKANILTIFSVLLVLFAAGSVAAQTSVAGEWDASMNTPGGARPMKLIFKVDGEKLTGTVKRSSGDVPLQGTIKGSDISFAYTVNYNGNDLTLSFSGKVKGDDMVGTVSFGGNADDSWTAKRVPPPAKPKS
jgi:D-glucosaminate-6-phosphate ammonia-lyase